MEGFFRAHHFADKGAMTSTNSALAKKPRRGMKILAWSVGALLVLGVGTWATFTLSPWPGTLLVRWLFEADAEKTNTELAALVEPNSVDEFSDISYDDADPDALLDVYFPQGLGANETLPTVVWVHGGGWVSGDKNQNDNYFRLIAAEGYTVVSLNYTIAPEGTYPLATHQILRALDFVSEQGESLHINAENLILAGDSAGGQLAAQVATVVTSPVYAQETGFHTSLHAGQLDGIILFCAALDPNALQGDSPVLSSFINLVMWAYTGTKGYDDIMSQAAPISHVTAEFPAAFISVGNGDGLAPMSYNFAKRLDELGVPTDTLFFNEDHEPALPHEYQFRLWELDDAELAFDRMLSYLECVTE